MLTASPMADAVPTALAPGMMLLPSYRAAPTEPAAVAMAVKLAVMRYTPGTLRYITPSEYVISDVFDVTFVKVMFESAVVAKTVELSYTKRAVGFVLPMVCSFLTEGQAIAPFLA